MKERGFVKQNIEKWKSYETELKNPEKDPSAISKLFIQITDDLAYARTFYRNRSVRVYLNDIAQLLFNDINKKAHIKFKSLVDFWTTELPVIMHKIRFELLFSFLLFSVAVAIGIITSIHQPEFARNILGDGYVNMTIQNIESNDPMAVYKKQNGLDMFLGITVNNIKVAFTTFILGLFFGIGTLFSLLRNGLMLGTFQYFFIERGLFKESFLTIWQHGTLEISAIIIAGAAGFTIGRGLILPGTYTRFQSLRLTARRGLKIMIGLIPVFIFAAFIEGFFTRHTDVSNTIRLTTIVLSLGFIIFYFVLYPFMVVRNHPEKLNMDDKVNSSKEEMPDFTKILNNEQLFGASLKIVKKSLPKIILSLLLISLGAGLLLALAEKQIFGEASFLTSIQNYFLLFNYHRFPLLILINTGLFVFIFFRGSSVVQASMDTKDSQQTRPKNGWTKITGLTGLAIILQVSFFLPLGISIPIFILILPVIILIATVFLNNQTSLRESIAETFKLLGNRLGSLLLLYLSISVLCAFLVFLFNPNSWVKDTPGLADIFYFPAFIREIISFISWNLNLSDTSVEQFTGFIFTFFHYFLASFCLFTIWVAMNILFFSLKEIKYGHELINRVNNIGNRKTMRGYEID